MDTLASFTNLGEAEISALKLSLAVATRSVCMSLVPAICIAWLLTRRRFPGRTLFDAMVHLPLVLPPVVVGYLLLLLLGTRGPIGGFLNQHFGVQLVFTTLGAAIATAVMSFPLMVRSMRIALENVDRGLEDAARTLGAGPWDRFLTVTLPLMLPGVLAGAVTAFAAGLGEFGAVITFVSNIPGETRTLPLALYTALQSPDGNATAARLAMLSFGLGLGGLLIAEVLARGMRRWLGALMLGVNVQMRRGEFALDAKFDAPTPGVTALFGRSGCGKTSLINVIAGLTADGSGKVCLDDECWLDSTANIRRRAEQRHVGYVFQDARLFPHYSVRGNLEYGARRVKGSLTAGLFDDVVSLLGLAPFLSRRSGGLSGGEKQRVALGRALLSQPRLLLLDEPLSSLDAARREEVLPYLERLRDHFAIPMVYVSHQFDEILRLATHVVVMDAGRVTASGELGAVSRSPALQAIVGPDAMGAVIDGKVTAIDAGSGLADVAIAQGLLRVPAGTLSTGQSLRVQLLARDLILAVSEPQGLSVRNQLRGVVRSIASSGGNDLVEVECAGVTLLSRVTGAATRELGLHIGTPVWVLVKAVSVSGLAR